MTTAVKTRKHVLTLKDLSPEETMAIVDRGIAYAHDQVDMGSQLAGKVLGIYFTKTSTRTRTSFSSAALRLGASIISYGPNDLQINTGENLSDTLQVLSQMLDGLVIRTAGSQEPLDSFKNHSQMALVNAMTLEEHPTQALADLTTIKMRFGDFTGLRMIYMGEGNNTAIALALALAKFPGVSIYFCTPAQYGLDDQLFAHARQEAKKNDSILKEVHDTSLLPKETDIIYTTRWQTTGTSKPDPNWRQDFEPFAVTEALMARYPEAIFMHDLPAHRGEEVEAAVIDGPRSIVFQQAENKAHSAKAVLEWCFS